MATNQVSFTTPGSDYSVELGQIERRRALADALQKQSMQPQEQQMAGGWVIPNSPFQGAAKLAQAFAAKRSQEKADLKQKELTSSIQSDYRNMLAKGLGQLQGTPAKTIQPDPQEAQQSADQGTPQVGVVNQPAQAPDPMAAMATFGSHPMGAQFMPMATQEISRQRLAQALGGGSTQMASAPAAAPQVPGPFASIAPTGGDPGMPAQQPQQAPQPAPAMQQPTGGPAGGLPMAAWLQVDPSGSKYMEQLAKDRTPINVRESGAVYVPGSDKPMFQNFKTTPGQQIQYGPQGATMSNVPGALPSMAALTQSQAGATEAGKAPYQLSTYNTPGAPRLLTHQQAIEAATGSPMPQPGQPPQAQSAQGLPANVPQQDASAFQYVQDQARQGRPAQALGNSQYSGPKSLGMPLQDQGESAQQTHAGAEVGKFFGDTYASLQRGAMDASGKLTRLSRMESLLKDVETGKLTPAGTNVAAYAKSLGIDIDPKLDNKQAAEVLTNEIALQARNPSGGAGMPGAMSDSDRNFLSSMTPGIAKTPGAREMIMETSRKLAKRDQEVAKLAREYYKKNGNTLDNGFFDELQNFSNANPLFKDMTAPGGNQLFATNPNTKQRIVSTDGGQTWKPAQ